MSAKEEKAAASIREKTQEAWKSHPRSELHVDVTASSATGRSEKDIEIHAVDDYVSINTHGEARLDREGCLILVKRVQQAFQVVA